MNLHETLNDRENKYGDFGKLAEAVQAMKAVYRAAPSWQYMTAVQRETLEQDILKTCRILYGDPGLRDSWLDKAGYSHLVVEQMDKAEAQRFKYAPVEPEHPRDLDDLPEDHPLNQPFGEDRIFSTAVPPPVGEFSGTGKLQTKADLRR